MNAVANFEFERMIGRLSIRREGIGRECAGTPKRTDGASSGLRWSTVRVNRAAVLLRECSPADSVRGLQAEFGLSERQARRYVNVAQEQPEGVAVPERTAVFTVRLAPSLIGGLRRARRRDRSNVERRDCRGGAWLSRAGTGQLGGGAGGLRSSSSATGSPARGWRRRTRRWRLSGGV